MIGPPLVRAARACVEEAHRRLGANHPITVFALRIWEAEVYIAFLEALPPRPSMTENQETRTAAILSRHTPPSGRLQPPSG